MGKEQDLERQYQKQLESLRWNLQSQLPADDNNTCIDVEDILASDRLDQDLVRDMVLYQATPKGLAEAVAQNPEQESLIQDAIVLDNAAGTALLKGMLNKKQRKPLQ